MNTGNGNSHAYPRKIRAVILDYGEVICRPPSTEHLGRMATLFRIPREEFLPIYVASRNPYDGGDVSAEEYWYQFAKSAGVEVNDSMVEKVREWDLDMWSSINPKMIEWLAAIHSAGFKTALLSNMQSDMASHARKHFDWLRHFDHLVLSCERAPSNLIWPSITAASPRLAFRQVKPCLSTTGKRTSKRRKL